MNIGSRCPRLVSRLSPISEIQLAALEEKLRKRHRYVASTLGFFFNLRKSPVR